MREEIRVAADRNGRSMNSEIIARLEDSLSAERGGALLGADEDFDGNLNRILELLNKATSAIERCKTATDNKVDVDTKD